jgi:hypothetical protein
MIGIGVSRPQRNQEEGCFDCRVETRDRTRATTATPYLQKPGQNGNEIAKFELLAASITAGSYEEKTLSFKAPPYGIRTKAANEGRSDDRCREGREGQAHCGPTPQTTSGDGILGIEKTLIYMCNAMSVAIPALVHG